MNEALPVFGLQFIEGDGLSKDGCIILGIRQRSHEIVNAPSSEFAGGDRPFGCIELAVVIKIETLLGHKESAHGHGVPVYGCDQLTVQLAHTWPAQIVYGTARRTQRLVRGTSDGEPIQPPLIR